MGGKARGREKSRDLEGDQSAPGSPEARPASLVACSPIAPCPSPCGWRLVPVGPSLLLPSPRILFYHHPSHLQGLPEWASPRSLPCSLKVQVCGSLLSCLGSCSQVCMLASLAVTHKGPAPPSPKLLLLPLEHVFFPKRRAVCSHPWDSHCIYFQVNPGAAHTPAPRLKAR